MDSTRLGMWIAIGVALGVSLGVAFGNVGLGVAFGPMIGILIWVIESAWRKRSGGADRRAGLGDDPVDPTEGSFD